MTVKLIPSTAIEPFFTIYLDKSPGASISSRMESPAMPTAAMRPMPSTWPRTMCPPKRESARMARSRFTRASDRCVFQRRQAERLQGRIRTESVALYLDHGQADPIHTDAVANGMPAGRGTSESRIPIGR